MHPEEQFAKTVRPDVFKGKPAVPEKEAPKKHEAIEAPRDIMRAAGSERLERGRIFFDARRGAAVLASGGDDVGPIDLEVAVTTASVKFIERLRGLGVDSKPVVDNAGGENVQPRRAIAEAALIGPFAEVEAGFFWRTQLAASEKEQPKEKRIPALVAAKIIRNEIVPEAIYGSPLNEQPRQSETDLNTITALNRSVSDAAAEFGSGSDAAYAERLQEILSPSALQEFLPSSRLFLYHELKGKSTGPRSSEAIERVLEPSLEAEESATVTDLAELVMRGGKISASPDAKSVERNIENVRHLREYQELSIDGKFALYLRLRGRAPAPDAVLQRLLRRERLLATTDAGSDVAIIVARANRDQVEDLAEGLPAPQREELPVETTFGTVTLISGKPRLVEAELYPGDLVVVTPRADVSKAKAAVRAARGLPPEDLSRWLASAGFDTNLVLEAGE